MKKKLPFIFISLVFFAAIAAAAFIFGIKAAPSSTETLKEYDLNQIFFIFKRLNQYSLASAYYRTMIFVYWYSVSLVLTWLTLKIWKKAKRGKKAKN